MGHMVLFMLRLFMLRLTTTRTR
eukprot:COSAG03_NODE_19931_length_327_cov_1.131579_1_plen_22_part_10